MGLIQISEQQQRIGVLIETRRRQAGAKSMAQHLGMSSAVCKTLRESLQAGAPVDREKLIEMLTIAERNLSFASGLVAEVETKRR